MKEKALLGAPKKPKAVPPMDDLVTVAREYGVSPLKQFRQQLQHQFGDKKSRLTSEEYYRFRLYRTDFDAAQRLEFVGGKSNLSLNVSLQGTSRYIAGFLSDKEMMEAVFGNYGLATTKTKGVVIHGRSISIGQPLVSQSDVEDFLRDETNFPLFGKPRGGSKSVGSALLSGIDLKQDLVLLGNDVSAPVADVSREIFEDYDEGYLLQTPVQQNARMSAAIGNAVGSVRLVTVNDGASIRTLYGVWKIPAEGAMSDNFWQDGSIIAAVDLATGEVTRCQQGTGLTATDVDEHPKTGKLLVGFQIPHWEAAKKLVTDAHSIFPKFGILGWDIAIGENAPLIIEVNTSPFHALYQIANDRGINNPDFVGTFDAVRSYQRSRSKSNAEDRKAFEARQLKH